MGRPWQALSAPLLVALALLTACSSSSTPAPTTASDGGATVTATSVPSTSPDLDLELELGVAAGRREGQTPIDALIAVETIADRQFAVLRTYSFWDSDFPDLREQLAQRDGKALHLSVNARREDGTIVPWNTIATAEPGTVVHDELTAWIERIAAYDGALRVTFHHEADIEPEFGTSEEFVNAWKRFADMMHQAAPDVPLAWVMTLSTIRGDDPELFWPGDDYVDWIAADAFNWFGCRGNPEAWRPPAELLDPLIQFGQAHPGKPLMFAEIGSDEDPDDPARKAAWLDELAVLMADDAYAPIKTIIFFHNDHDDESTCDWWIDSSPEAAAAFSELAATELFGGDDAPSAATQCPAVSTTFARADDRAIVDGDGDGRFDFVFGAENRFLGIGDQSNDGSDHRVAMTFDAIGELPADATVELRIRVGSQQPALPSAVQLLVLGEKPESDRDAFSLPGTAIDETWFDAQTVDGHHTIDVTPHANTSTSTTFRLQLEATPPNDDGKAPLFIGMSEAGRSIDRPALVVRSC